MVLIDNMTRPRNKKGLPQTELRKMIETLGDLICCNEGGGIPPSFEAVPKSQMLLKAPLAIRSAKPKRNREQASAKA